MRVIAGSAKGRKLKPVPGDSTRPVMDRVKEAVFSIIGRDILDARFLDLFSGTGGVGIEALSRGAVHATLVERDRLAVRTIQENLTATHLGEKAAIRRVDVFQFLKQPPSPIPFDFIYVAPPQYKDLWLNTLNALDANPRWIGEDTVVIVQMDPKEYKETPLEHLEEYDQRKYGRTLVVFYQRLAENNADDQSPPTEESQDD
jgi:16S rRNA (guanine(966)-N(2))-methyltransferase RsmD